MKRRKFVQTIGGILVAAPAIVRASSLMPVHSMSEKFGGKSICLGTYTGTEWYGAEGVQMMLHDSVNRVLTEFTVEGILDAQGNDHLVAQNYLKRNIT